MNILTSEGGILGSTTKHKGLYHLHAVHLLNGTERDRMVLPSAFNHKDLSVKFSKSTDAETLGLLDADDGSDGAGVWPPVYDRSNPVWDWHWRLGHLLLDAMKKLVPLSEGMPITMIKQIDAQHEVDCPFCVTVKKSHQIQPDLARQRFANVGELVHFHIMQKVAREAEDQVAVYFMLATDDATCYTWAHSFPDKKDLMKKVEIMVDEIERSHGINIRKARFDNIIMFGRDPTKDWAERKNIAVEIFKPYAFKHNVGAIRDSVAIMTQRNVSAELINRMCENSAQKDTTLKNELWIEAVYQAVWLQNRTPTKLLELPNKTPWEALRGTKPDLSCECIWGSRAYQPVPPGNAHSEGGELVQPRSTTMYFVRNELESTMKLWDPKNKKVIRSSSARVDQGHGLDDPHPEQSLDEKVLLKRSRRAGHDDSTATDKSSERKTKSKGTTRKHKSHKRARKAHRLRLLQETEGEVQSDSHAHHRRKRRMQRAQATEGNDNAEGEVQSDSHAHPRKKRRMQRAKDTEGNDNAEESEALPSARKIQLSTLA